MYEYVCVAIFIGEKKDCVQIILCEKYHDDNLFYDKQ